MLCGNLVRLSAILYVLEIVLYPLCKGPNNQLSQVHTTSDKIRNCDTIYKCLSAYMLYALFDANAYDIDVYLRYILFPLCALFLIYLK